MEIQATPQGANLVAKLNKKPPGNTHKISSGATPGLKGGATAPKGKPVDPNCRDNYEIIETGLGPTGPIKVVVVEKCKKKLTGDSNITIDVEGLKKGKHSSGGSVLSGPQVLFHELVHACQVQDHGFLGTTDEEFRKLDLENAAVNKTRSWWNKLNPPAAGLGNTGIIEVN